MMTGVYRVALLVLLGALTAHAEDEGLQKRLTKEWGSKKTAKPLQENVARRARVAVMPAIYGSDVRKRFLSSLPEALGAEDPGEVFNPDYTTFLVDALVNLEQYDVLERNDLVSAVKELDFGESDYADDDKVARLGSMLNADYVVLPVLRYLSWEQIDKDIPYINKTQKKMMVKVATAVRTVDVRTGRIVTSGIRKGEAKHSQTDETPLSVVQVQDLVEEVYQSSTSKEAKHIADTIQSYPDHKAK